MPCDQSPETLVMVWSRLALEANHHHHHHVGKFPKINDILKGKASIMSALNAKVNPHMEGNYHFLSNYMADYT